MINRPMCFNGSATSEQGIIGSIACALRQGGHRGKHPGKTDPIRHRHLAPDGRDRRLAEAGIAAVTDLCTNTLRPNSVGLVIYNFGILAPFGTPLTNLIAAATAWDTPLNPRAAAPGSRYKSR
jgi:hypothetical protein